MVTAEMGLHDHHHAGMATEKEHRISFTLSVKVIALLC